MWPKYATEVLLPRLSGFELMMAPYTIAHLKLGMTLATQGVELSSRRLGVYLTNTLDEGIPHQPDLLRDRSRRCSDTGESGGQPD